MEIYDEIGIVLLCIRMGIRADEPHMHITARDDRQKNVAVVELSILDTRSEDVCLRRGRELETAASTSP